MRPGRHTAADGSFNRSAGTQGMRAVLLVAVAVILGVILLNTANKPPASTVSTSSPTTHKSSGTTTTLPAETTTTTPLRAPKDVKVLPANGTTVNGAGARVGTTLASGGYNVLAAVSASSNSVTASAVYYTQGYDREAAALATLLSLPASAAQPMPTPAPVPDTKGANIVVVVGPDLARAGSTTATTAAVAHTTTTTAHASTTSTTAHSSTSTTAKPATTSTTTH